MFENVPKDFLTKLYIGAGPWGPGPYATTCTCGRPLDPDDEQVVLFKNQTTGKLMAYHEECVERLNA